MAEVKISQLDEASSADGDIVIPVVQAGTTKKITLSNLLFANSITSAQLAANSVGDSEAASSLVTSLTTSVSNGITPAGIGAATTAQNTSAQSAADAAQATANTKARTFVSTTAPAAEAVGDIWIHQTTGQFYRATGTGTGNWGTIDLIVEGSVTADKIAANSITSTQLTTATIDAIKVSASNINTNTIVTDVLNGLTINTNQLAANAVNAGKLSTNAIQTKHLQSGTISALSLNASQITAGTISSNRIGTNTINATHISTNFLTSAVIAANSITTDQIAANSITSNLIASNEITADEIRANNVTADAIIANAITSQAISSGAVASEGLSANSVTSDKLVTGATITGNLASLNFDGQITGPDGNGDYNFALGNNGFYMHGDSGTAVVNTLIARNNIITGNMVKFDDSLHGLETDNDGNIKVKTDGTTMTVENGAIKILSVPQNAVVNSYSDINWTGYHNGIAMQTYTFANSNLVTTGTGGGGDGTDRGVVTNVFKLNADDHVELPNGSMSNSGNVNLYNLTLVIDPRGISNLAGFASGGNVWRFIITSRWSTTANNTGALSSLSTRSQMSATIAPYGSINPVLPNALIEHKIAGPLNFRRPDPDIPNQKYLHVWIGMQLGAPTGNSAYVAGDNIKVGIKNTNDTYMTFSGSGTLTSVSNNMSDLIDNQNLFGDYS